MPSPSKKVLSDLKASILNPALTSHFQCWFNPPPKVRNWITEKVGAGLGIVYDGNAEFISLSCAEASLPGSSLATHEINNDHTGVTERHAYRRQYDATTAFTFYVDHDYDIIYFFENWMSFIVNEQSSQGLLSKNYSYRVNFPKTYQTELYINKFERDYRGRYLEYRFLNAYPISIDSMPVSYETSQLLKCTVTFNYSRYVIGGKYLETINQDQTEFQNSIDRGVRLGGIPGTRTIGQTGAGTFAELNQINGDIG